MDSRGSLHILAFSGIIINDGRSPLVINIVSLTLSTLPMIPPKTWLSDILESILELLKAFSSEDIDVGDEVDGRDLMHVYQIAAFDTF